MNDSSKDFYTEFAEIYDQLVSLESRIFREGPFWQSLVDEFHLTRALDLACGTGHHAVILSEMGLEVTAMDLSKSMLNIARNHAKSNNLPISFIRGDFRDLSSFKSKGFDFVVCLGNSLPYVNDETELNQVISQVSGLLEDKGLFAIEMRNYDFLLAQKPRFFPMSFHEDSVFIYALDYKPTHIIFNILFVNTKTHEFRTFETTYRPILLQTLERCLSENGFQILHKYEDANKQKFLPSKSSRYLILSQRLPKM